MDARAELRTLPKDLAAKVARHLVMAGRLAEDEPEQSYKHAKAARRLASRVGIVREAAGIAAYHAGEWAEALAELRAARRLGAGDDSYLPVMADCERGLGRPERALDLIKSPEAAKLDPAGRVELRIVESGVRRDMGQYDAAVVTLQIPELRDRRLRPWSMRLFYAYADALAEAGREGEAADWFARAAAADRDGDTDAAERYAEIEGLHILDTEEEEGEGAEVTDEASAPEEDAVDDTVAEGTNLDDGENAEGAREGEVPSDSDAPANPAAPGEPEAQADHDEPEAPGKREVQAERGEAGASESGASESGVSEEPGARAERGEAGVSEAGVSGEREVRAERGETGVSEAGASGEPGAATDIAFKPAEPEVLEAPDENAPDAPAVFLEPRSADGEERPAGD